MDYNTDNNNINRTGSWSHNPGSIMASVAMFLGIAAVFTIFTVYLPLIFGSLAIILAILSKGYGRKLMVTAKVGIGTAIGSLSIITFMMGSVIALLFSSSANDLIKMGQQIDQYYEHQTGVTLEDTIGESYEDIMKQYVEILGK